MPDEKPRKRAVAMVADVPVRSEALSKPCAECATKDAKIAELETALRVLSR